MGNLASMASYEVIHNDSNTTYFVWFQQSTQRHPQTQVRPLPVPGGYASERLAPGRSTVPKCLYANYWHEVCIAVSMVKFAPICVNMRSPEGMSIVMPINVTEILNA